MSKYFLKLTLEEQYLESCLLEVLEEEEKLNNLRREMAEYGHAFSTSAH